VIPKKLAPPVPAYDNRIECTTIEELEAIEVSFQHLTENMPSLSDENRNANKRLHKSQKISLVLFHEVDRFFIQHF